MYGVLCRGQGLAREQALIRSNTPMPRVIPRSKGESAGSIDAGSEPSKVNGQGRSNPDCLAAGWRGGSKVLHRPGRKFHYQGPQFGIQFVRFRANIQRTLVLLMLGERERVWKMFRKFRPNEKADYCI